MIAKIFLTANIINLIRLMIQGAPETEQTVTILWVALFAIIAIIGDKTAFVRKKTTEKIDNKSTA